LNRVILSLGHSVRPQEETIALLQENAISLLIDVRAFPRSRRNPQYNSDALARALQETGIGYRHFPELGGMRKPRVDSTNLGLAEGFRGFADYMQTPKFSTALTTLMTLAERQKIAVMCAEAKPTECHRSLISDALSAQGLEVRHIIGPGLTEPHSLTRSAEVQGTQVSYPFGLIG
jgi:uncharacterized protein (DUF488 family)